ncbi:MAG: hypothetical protein HY288_16355 [Planctomycetia bacterium]|nr:hypothetical protein [Planctomycetia bacterium]
MTLKKQLQRAIANIPLFSSGEHLLEISHNAQKLRCQLVALDSLACSFTKLALHADTLAAMSLDQLKRTAEQLSTRLTYLLEPISPIEVDAHGCVVQLRSNPPQKETDRTSYYELLVSRSGELSLCRFSRAPGEQRQIIPSQVTREVLARLAADFSAAAG